MFFWISLPFETSGPAWCGTILVEYDMSFFCLFLRWRLQFYQHILKKHGGFTSTTTASVCFPKAFDSLDAASIKLVGQVCGRVAFSGPLVDSFCCWLDSVSLILMLRLLNDATYTIYTAHRYQRDVPLRNSILCESVLPEFLKIVFLWLNASIFFKRKHILEDRNTMSTQTESGWRMQIHKDPVGCLVRMILGKSLWSCRFFQGPKCQVKLPLAALAARFILKKECRCKIFPALRVLGSVKYNMMIFWRCHHVIVTVVHCYSSLPDWQVF